VKSASPWTRTPRPAVRFDHHRLPDPGRELEQDVETSGDAVDRRFGERLVDRLEQGGALAAVVGAGGAEVAVEGAARDQLGEARAAAVERGAGIVGCEFCIDFGSEWARRAGLTEEQLRNLHDAHASGLVPR